MKRLHWLKLVLVLILVVNPLCFQAAKVQAATLVPVTFTITRVEEVHCADGLPETCPNDYYPKFNIDNQGLFDGKELFCCEESTDFRPNNWAHMRMVDSSHNLVQIHIELWDQDDFSGDDIVDIAAGDARSLDLTFDLNACTFQGSGLTVQQGAGIMALLQGQSQGGPNESARITFTITTPTCLDQAYNIDSDGDGLPNGWELMGLNIEDPNVQPAKVLPVVDGTPDLALHTDPFHKDLFVEVDWMECSSTFPCIVANHSHAPEAGVLDDVIQAFKNAPVENPDGSKGITFHAIQDEALQEQFAILFDSTRGPGNMDDFDDIKLGKPDDPCDGSFGTKAERTAANCAKILAAKRLVFRYMIFGHSYTMMKDGKVTPTNGSSGRAELGFQPNGPALGGNDFIVTLGDWDADKLAKAGGKRGAEASTFMHELGHTLGLDHGGGDGINCKPNYLSIMNYTLQFPTMDPNRPLDYTSAAKGTNLGPLNENGGLDEMKGIAGPAGRLAVYGVNGKWRTAAANAPIDWNGINGLEPSLVSADINYISTISSISESGGCDKPSQNQTLNGFDDWQHIQYNFRESSDFADGVRGPSLPELTGDEVVAMSARADLKVTKSVDKATAIGGDTLNYNVPVTNVGRGKAINISLTDTLPDGSMQIRTLPDLDKDASNTQAFTYLVPCTTSDGALLTNHVSVTATDENGIPDPDLADNTAQAATTVQTPVLTLAKTATAAVNAGEAIIYTITYENTGGAAATNVVIADVLPAGIYYSQALDLGAGPKPNTVTLNADGTRTLVWNVATAPGHSGPQTINFTARPTLLALSGAAYGNNVSLSFQNGKGCAYAAVNATAATNITVTPPTRDPLSMGFWRTHPEAWTSESLARIQATDQRYDTDGDGALSVTEATTMLAPGGNQPKVLQMQLLAAYFNLATRRINADTTIRSKTADSLGLVNVANAATFSIGALLLPAGPPNAARDDDATRVLDEINNNQSEVY